jgi:hypothetical protein
MVLASSENDVPKIYGPSKFRKGTKIRICHSVIELPSSSEPSSSPIPNTPPSDLSAPPSYSVLQWCYRNIRDVTVVFHICCSFITVPILITPPSDLSAPTSYRVTAV